MLTLIERINLPVVIQWYNFLKALTQLNSRSRETIFWLPSLNLVPSLMQKTLQDTEDCICVMSGAHTGWMSVTSKYHHFASYNPCMELVSWVLVFEITKKKRKRISYSVWNSEARDFVKSNIDIFKDDVFRACLHGCWKKSCFGQKVF